MQTGTKIDDARPRHACEGGDVVSDRYELEYEEGVLVAVIDHQPPAELVARMADPDNYDDCVEFIPDVIDVDDEGTWFPEGCTTRDGRTSVTWWRH